MSDADHLADRLRVRLSEQWGNVAVTIEGLKKMAGGASRSTWSFDAAASGRRSHRLVARLVDPGRTFVPSIAVEAAAIDAAGRVGAPVPKLTGLFNLAERSDEEEDQLCLVMERVDGETIGRRVMRDAEYEQARRRFAQQCGSALALIHSVPASDAFERYDPFDRLLSIFAEVDEPSPVFELAFAWLADHRPPPVPGSLVHGDFRLGNLVIGPDGLRAVLDWESAHVGDPLEDLGWLCVKAWRFGSDPPVAGLGSYDELCASYEAAGGRPVDRVALRWWEMFGTLRWGVSCTQMASWHRSGAMRSVELAAIGRRACENEWDLLELLDEYRAHSD